MERRWISPKEAAIYLSLNFKTIYRLIDKGDIPATRIGGSVRVDLKALNERLGARRVKF